MDHQSKALWQEWYFWASIGVPFGISFVLASLLWANGFGYKTLCWNPVCYKSFIEAFELPIGVFAVAIPLTALAAAAHRSSQTKRQIELQNSQNVFSNYYKHLEEFVKFCEAKNPPPQDLSTTSEGLSITAKTINQHMRAQHREYDYRALHSKLFPLARRGDLNISPTWASSASRLIEAAKKAIPVLETIEREIQLLPESENDATSKIHVIRTNDLKALQQVGHLAEDILSLLMNDKELVLLQTVGSLIREVGSASSHLSEFLAFEATLDTAQLRLDMEDVSKLADYFYNSNFQSILNLTPRSDRYWSSPPSTEQELSTH